MRRLPGVLVLAILAGAVLVPPLPTQPVMAATAKADPAYDSAKAAADSSGPAAIAALQRSLILTGDLNALATGEFGKRSFEAIKAFQKRGKGAETGILTSDEKARLDQESGKVSAAYGFKTITEQGTTVSYPAKVATTRTAGRRGPKFTAAGDSVTVDILFYPPGDEAYDALFERLKKPRAGRTITYSLKKPDAFVITGSSDGMNFYMRFLATSGGTRGFVLGWKPALSPDFDRVPIFMASSLTAEGQIAPPLPVANKPSATTADQPVVAAAGPVLPFEPGKTYGKRTGLGAVVSAAGDVLLAADIVVGCETLAVEGAGSARVIAGDTVNNIALARLEKPSGAVAALRTTPPLQDEKLSAQSLGADGSVTASDATVTALADAAGDMRRFIAAGVPGSALLFDPSGALVSPKIAAAPTPDGADAVALKPLFVSAFLRGQGVTAGPAADPTKAVVKVTCDKTQG
jgi:hypothetical protein